MSCRRRVLGRLILAATGIVLVIAAEPAPPANWALRPVVRPVLPGGGRLGVRHPLDAFIAARLDAAGLAMAPPADRATLIRRATYDLHGLPPSPAEIDDFVNDASPDAYERLIDRLLASPRYGERWGRHWLDLARFAESQGFERDKIREHAWRYRDYVICSLNADKPYDQFVREQIAGDLLPEAGRDGIIATGFLVAGPYDEAGNTSASALLRARIREDELEDIIGTVCQTFLGLTVNCARCHDHKFDPIPQRDYYRIKSVFDAVRPGDRSILTAEQQRRRDAQRERLGTEIARAETELARLETTARDRLRPVKAAALPPGVPAPVARWTFDTDARDQVGTLHGTLRGAAVVRHGRLVLDGAGAFVETEPLATDLHEKTLEAWVTLATLAQRGGGIMSVQTLGGGTFDAIVYGERQPGKWLAGSDFFRRTRDRDEADESAGPGDLVHVAVVYSRGDQIALYRNGKRYGAPYRPDGPEATLRTYAVGKAQVLFGLRHSGAGNGYFHGAIEEARLYDRALSADEVEASYRFGVAAVAPAEIRGALNAELRERWDALQALLGRLRRTRQSLEDVAQAYAANPKSAGPTAVLLRGDVEKKGETVSAGGVSCVHAPAADFGLSPDAPEGERRLRFARWVTDPAHPLTARVMVNRLWQHHLGRGLVDTPGDFGVNGGRPSHPELLDWLASEFVTRGWSLKAMHRLIMTSAVYRQSARFDARAASIDADDRLLWRFAPRRLEAEAVRDAMLAVSGELNPHPGGPGFRPFRITVFNSTFYDLFDDGRPEFNRRTVYRIGVNSAKDPLLESFDCPEPSVRTPRRSTTTTPIQALGLMNNPFVQRQARALAQRVKSESPDPVGRAYLLALGRPPGAVERQRAEVLAREHGLASLCWVLLNSSEFLYVR